MIQISDSTSKRERARIRELAKEYKLKGYEVIIEPRNDQLPDFLAHVHPDMIATSDSDNVVIEVKSTKSLIESNELKRLASIIEKNKKWRFELVLSNPRYQQQLSNEWSLLSIEDIQKKLIEVNNIFINDNKPDCAMLLLWVLVEATLNHISKQESVSFEKKSPKKIIKNLYSLGVINKEAYVTLNNAVDLRNGFVHGYTTKSSISTIFKSTSDLTSRLINKVKTNMSFYSTE